MALADLITKIQADAEQQSADISAQAASDVAQIVADAEEKSIEVATAVAADTEKKADQMLNKVQNLARQEHKASMLNMRREMLADVATDAATQLKQLGDTDRQTLFLELLQDISIENPTILPVKGDEAAVKKALQTAKKEFTLGDAIDGIGGFIVVGSDLEVDCRFDTLLEREIVQQSESHINNLLFGKN